jgi:hypothetical protein
MKIVLICGVGRSGTTIFGRAIAHVLGAFNVGEMIYLRSRSIDGNQLCGCGERFSDCGFWSDVIRADPGFAESARIVESHARWRYLPALVLNLIGLRNERICQAAEAVKAMFATVGQTSGATTIVDTSKTIPYAFLLMNTGLAVDYVLVVRDVRDVVHRTQKFKFIPELGREDRLHKRSSSFYYLQWLVVLVFQLVIRSIRRRARFLGYNAYVIDHLRINRRLWQEAEPVDFSQPVQVPRQHDVAGNPSRFGQTIQLKTS